MISTQHIRQIIIENLLKNPKLLFEQEEETTQISKLYEFDSIANFGKVPLTTKRYILGDLVNVTVKGLDKFDVLIQIQDNNNSDKLYNVNFFTSPVYRFIAGFKIKFKNNDDSDTISEFIYNNQNILKKYQNIIKSISDPRVKNILDEIFSICHESEYGGFSLPNFVAFLSCLYHFQSKKYNSAEDFFIKNGITEDLNSFITDLNQLFNDQRKFLFKVYSISESGEDVTPNSPVNIYLKRDQFEDYIPNVEDLSKIIIATLDYAHTGNTPKNYLPSDEDNIEKIEEKTENENEEEIDEKIDQNLFNLQKNFDQLKQNLQTGMQDLLSKNDNQLNGVQKIIKNLIKTAIDEQNKKIENNINDIPNIEEPIETVQTQKIELTDQQKAKIDQLLKNAQYPRAVGNSEQSKDITKKADVSQHVQQIIEQEKIKIKHELEEKLKEYYKQEAKKAMQDIFRNKNIFGEFDPKSLKQELTKEQIEYIQKKMQEIQNNATEIYNNYQIAQRAEFEKKQQALKTAEIEKSQQEFINKLKKAAQDLKDYNSSVEFTKSINININLNQKIDYTLTPEMEATYNKHMQEIQKQQQILQNAIETNKKYTQYLKDVENAQNSQDFLNQIEKTAIKDLEKKEKETQELEKAAKEKIEAENQKQQEIKNSLEKLKNDIKNVLERKKQAENAKNAEEAKKANEILKQQENQLKKQLEAERNSNREKVEVAIAIAKQKQQQVEILQNQKQKENNTDNEVINQGNTNKNVDNKQQSIKSNDNSNNQEIDLTKNKVIKKEPELEKETDKDKLKIVEPIPIEGESNETPQTKADESSESFKANMLDKDNLGDYNLKKPDDISLNIPSEQYIFKIPQLDKGYFELGKILTDINLLMQLKQGGRSDKQFENKNFKYGYYQLDDQDLQNSVKWFTNISKEFLTSIGTSDMQISAIEKDMKNPNVIGKILNNYFDNRMIKTNEYLLIDDEFRLYVLFGVLIKNKFDIKKIEGADALIQNKNPIVLKASINPNDVVNRLENKVDLSKRITIQQMFKNRKKLN